MKLKGVGRVGGRLINVILFLDGLIVAELFHVFPYKTYSKKTVSREG